MGYIIACYGERDHGKTTTIKELCIEIESTQNSCSEVLFKDKNTLDDGSDILRAYRRFGMLVFIISGGDDEKIVKEGYKQLKFSCGGNDCDLLVCALTQNKYRQTGRITKIEEVIEGLAEKNGHWIDWFNVSKYFNKGSLEEGKCKKYQILKDKFLTASDKLTNNVKW